MQDNNYQHEPQSAASQTPIIDMLRTAWHEAKRMSLRRIPRFDIPENEFMEELRAHGCIIIAEGGDDYPFEYDDKIKPVAHQLWLYTTGNSEFIGSLTKGIALVGYYGCGKSLLMEAYSRLINTRIDYHEKRMIKYDFITSQNLFSKVKEDGMAPFIAGNMILDELGREAKVSKQWGNEALPVADVLFERHRKGLLTHITANFTLEDLSGDEMYGEMLGDRFKEMFNFIHMGGGSRRK